MKSGDKVMIYQTPSLNEDPEGQATLIREIRPDEGDGLSMWEVKFEDDGTNHVRTIMEAK